MGLVMLDLPYVTLKRAKGREYYYYRRAGKWYPLPKPEAADFRAKYDEIHKSFALAKEPVIEGRFGWLIQKYKASPEFKGLAPRTQDDYTKQLDALPQGWNSLAIHQISRAGIFAHRDTLAHSPRQANYAVQVIRLLFTWAINRGLAKSNPALSPGRLKEGDGHKPWPDDAVAEFRKHNAADEMMLIALELGLYIGIREGDLCKMTVADYSDGKIKAMQNKTHEPIWVPAHPQLKATLETIRGRILMIQTVTGRPFTENHFRHKWRAAILKANLDGYTFHGLRTTAGTYLAEAGCTDAEIQAVLGHLTPSQAAHYRRHASKKKLAESAILKLEQSRPRM